MKPMNWRTFLLLAVLGSQAGCLGGGGATTRYYLIDPLGVPEAAASGQPLAVEIMDLDVPQYLERFHIATRDADNGLHYSEYNQWGETLRKNLLRTLAINLGRQLGTSDVATPLNRSLTAPDIRVKVHVDRFERGADGIVYLDARWQVSSVRSGDVSATQSANLAGDVTVGESDFDAMVSTMRRLFGDLSARIAASIRTEAEAG